MKKRILALLICGIMSASLAACGGSGQSASTSIASDNSSAALIALQESYDQLQEDYNTLQENYNQLQKDYDTLNAENENLENFASEATPAPTEESEEKTYGLGETWTIDGQWSLTFNSVTTTDERNQFSDKTPAQVVILDYTYQNIGYEGSFMDLYVSDSSMDIIDSNGQLADSYPVSTPNNPQETPVGVTCANAQVAIGLNNQSYEIQIIVSLYDSNSTEHSATFIVPVQ